MQSYQDIPDTTTLTASRSLLLNNILTALSMSSGTAFPTSNLVVGMPCFRTDLNKTYILTNTSGPVWTLWVDHAKTVAYTDGTGAGGTWGISITGNANTATTASYLSGFTNSNSGNPIGGADNALNNGVGYVTGMSILGQTDGALHTQAYSSSWIHQIYGDYRTGQMAVRGRNNGSWTGWRTVWDSSNLTNLNQLSNGPGYITGINSSMVTSALGYTPMNASNTTFGSISIASTANYIYMQDTDWGTRHMHHNQGLLGWLDSSGNWSVYDNNAGQIWTKNYGWLHDYFFSSVGNCIRATGFGPGQATTNLTNCVGESNIVNCYGGGNVYATQFEMMDNGSQISSRLVRYYYNCNCNCACACTCK